MSKPIVPKTISDFYKEYTSDLNRSSSEFERVNGGISEILKKLEFISEEIVRLRGERDELRVENCKLKTRIDLLERRSLDKSVELTGLKVIGNDPLRAVAEYFKQNLELSLEGQLDKVFVRKGREENPAMTISFVSSRAKKTLMQKYMERVKAKSFLSSNGKTRIYINDALTPTTRRQLWMAKQLKSKNKIAAYWTRGSFVFIKISTDDRIQTRINGDDQLEKINGEPFPIDNKSKSSIRAD